MIWHLGLGKQVFSDSSLAKKRHFASELGASNEK